MNNLWQSSDWKTFQELQGHEATWLHLKNGKCLLLSYQVGYGIRYGYIPRGPMLNPHQLEREDHKILKNTAKKLKLGFIRIDPTTALKGTKGMNVKKSHSPQPETTRILDLSQSEEEILKQMKRKGRYNIQLAQKKGLRLELGRDTEIISRFYKLLKETTKRDAFSAHNEKYYQNLVASVKSAEVLIISKGNEDLASMILIKEKPISIYYYGASSNRHRELMAPYLLQWEAIKRAKAFGATQYDLLGIAPIGAPANHPWVGITQFKNKFGGEEVQYPAARDLIFSSRKYLWFGILKQMQALMKRR